MNIEYLSYILIIAKKENMTKAAEELFVPWFTLSQYPPKLEGELGTPFLYQSKGRLTLIVADRLYIDAAEKVMSIKDNLYQNIQNLGNRGHIAIGVTFQFAPRMLTELTPPFKSGFPDVTIEISETSVPSLAQLVLKKNIDCGIMALNAVEPSSRDQARVFRREGVFFAIPRARPYCRTNSGRSATMPGLVRYFSEDNVLMSKRGSTLHCLTDQIIEAASQTPNTMCETSGIITTRSMVAVGIDVTFIGASCVIDREHVSYYPLGPRLHRLNASVTRKN